MLTKPQWTSIGFLVGLPIAIFVFFYFSNPQYTANFFDLSGPIIAPNIVIFLSVANFLLLYFGFRSVNKQKAKQKNEERLGFPCRGIALMMLSLILFTLPNLWLVILYPAVVIVMNEGL